MEYREFGKAKVKVSAIGMGTYYDPMSVVASHLLGHLRNKEEKLAALQKGLELGINLIDTAEIYGTEPLVAEAIRDFKRDDLFITTKVFWNHLRYSSVLRAAERSLRRLRTSYIDLYLIHMPNNLVPIRDTMKAMEKLVDDGKIRYIGVSNFTLALMMKADEALSKYELVSNQVEYNLVERDIESDLLPFCEQNNIAIMAHRPIAHGALVNPPGTLKEIMNDLSQKYGGKTFPQIALNWLLNKSKLVFPIPRASKTAKVLENYGSLGWNLDKYDLERLEKESSRLDGHEMFHQVNPYPGR